MSLFQKIIVKKYLNNLPSDLIEENYKKYTKYFNDFGRAERIRALKEEQYQEGFLRELFVECLNYTINPDEDYNLTTEFKNKTDAEKADGAILKDGKPIAVIELKSTKTKDLKSIEKQAFNYKAHQSNCKYVITSNFEKIRLYINDATEFEEFDVFELSENEFKFLYLCLSKESIFEDIPAKIKEKSNLHEEQISKKLYNDYSVFRNRIFQNLTKNNPQIDELLLFKKSQKLLDRFLFIFFAEDKGLIPPNFISKIINDYNKLKEMDHYTPLYSEFKRYFGYINEGNEKYNIDAYNGGLFQFDGILDNIEIDDEILITDSLKLSNYDFDSEIDVNILGHIFEHSLTDIEKLNAEIIGEGLDKKQTRRKKEGIFYTPNYITKYIVENTVGTLCSEKKNELQLNNLAVDETYFKKAKKTNSALSKKGEQLFDKLENYKEWLLSLKILDPACGSGAFLNQTLNFLIYEHNFIIDLETDLRKEQLFIFDIDTAVLENNLYGVDINEESVEIAKLSLWLKTAKKGRKLTDLSKNIKCGNSLIDDPEIAGDKAFDWTTEFPEIMQNGGFDVVIGNPPYVSYYARFKNIMTKEEEIYYKRKYDFISKENRVVDKNQIKGKFNTIMFFLEKSYKLLKFKGYCSLIVDLNISKSPYKDIRNFIIENTIIKEVIIDIQGWLDVGSGQVIILFCNDRDYNNDLILKIRIDDRNPRKIPQLFFNSFFSNTDKNIHPKDITSIIVHKIENNSQYKLADLFPKKLIRTSINFGAQKEKFLTNKSNKNAKPLAEGSLSITKKYCMPNIESHIIYDKSIIHRINQENIKDVIIAENKQGKVGGLGDPIVFKNPKIIVRQAGSPIVATYIKDELYLDYSLFSISNTNSNKNISDYDLKSILAILNSKLLSFYAWHKNIIEHAKGGTPQMRINGLRRLPIPTLKNENMIFLKNKSNFMLSLNKQLQEKKNKFLHRLETNFEIEKLSNKMKTFYDYDFKILINELKKKKVKLSLSQQDEWEEYFNNYKEEINKLQNQINQTDKEIDQMVYELYGLTDEEIEIVENG